MSLILIQRNTESSITKMTQDHLTDQNKSKNKIKKDLNVKPKSTPREYLSTSPVQKLSPLDTTIATQDTETKFELQSSSWTKP